MLLLSIALLAAVVALIHRLATRNFYYWSNRGVTFLKPFPIVGSIWPLLSQQQHTSDFYQKIYDSHKGKNFVGYFECATPGLVVLDPALVKRIMIKDFWHFSDHGFRVNDSLNSRNLFNMEGKRWREMRNKLTPTFTSGKIKAMFPLVEACAKNLEDFASTHQHQDVDSKDLMARFTTDVIATCAFGLSVDSIAEPENQFRVMGRKMMEVDFAQGLNNACIIFMPQLAKMLSLNFFPDEVSNFFRALVKDVIAKRLATGNTRKDFMQLLIQLKEVGSITLDDNDAAEEAQEIIPPAANFKLDDDDIVAQAIIFFFAGFETSSSTQTFALMELARAPELQRKARENIAEVLGRHGGVISYQALQEMTYLDWIIQETLRMYPPAPTLSRVCTKNYVIPDSEIAIDEGTIMTFPIHSMHRDPANFKDPDTFNPERFADNETLRNSQGAYMPFGDGPRQCVAMRFARMQTKLGLYAILHKLEVVESAKTKYPPTWDPKQVLLASKEDIFIQLKAA